MRPWRVVQVLVLSRKVGDVIAIGDNIKIIVMSIKGKQVKLGIEADKSTIVHREEIYQKIKQENCEAMRSHPASTNEASDILKQSDVKDEIENKPRKIIIRPKKTI